MIFCSISLHWTHDYKNSDLLKCRFILNLRRDRYDQALRYKYLLLQKRAVVQPRANISLSFIKHDKLFIKVSTSRASNLFVGVAFAMNRTRYVTRYNAELTRRETSPCFREYSTTYPLQMFQTQCIPSLAIFILPRSGSETSVFCNLYVRRIISEARACFWSC